MKISIPQALAPKESRAINSYFVTPAAQIAV